MNKDIFKDLNKEQQKAVLQTDGPMIILAGAGSGKTRVLTYKVIYLIKEKGIETGTTTTKSKGEVFNDCKEIDAISGENEISITAFNKGNTVQGYMQTAKFTSSVKQEEPHLYILSIGIDQYKDSTINLKYAVKDSTDIKERIFKQAETLYKPQNIHYQCPVRHFRNNYFEFKVSPTRFSSL